MKKDYFVNCSNHPSEMWSPEQRKAAEQYGEILDIPFPLVDAEADEEEVGVLGEKIFEKIMSHAPAAVLCQGEFSLTFQVVQRLLIAGITVLAACSERNVVEEMKDGKYIKHMEYQFVRFRRFERII